jgi:hypothetical protein
LPNRPRLAPLFVAAVVLVTLSGCIASPASPSSAPASEAVARPTPTSSAPTTASPAAPTPTAAPVDAVDPAEWVIDGAGIGPVRRGAAVPAAAVLAPYEEVSAECPNPNVRRYQARADLPELMTVAGDDGTAVEWVSVSAWTPGGVADSPSTENGVRLGSDLAELQSAYPGIEVTKDYGGTLFYGTSSAGGWVVFTVQSGVVVAITSSPASTIPTEFCG